MKKLYRSDNKMIAGVLAGFAEYINVDPTIVRLIYVLLGLIACIPVLLFYIICWIVIPKKSVPKVSHETEVKEEAKKETASENIVEEKIEPKEEN